MLDRALADPAFVRGRLSLVESGAGGRAKEWAVAAFVWADLHLAWTTTADKASAVALENTVLVALRSHALWNRLRPR